MPAPLPPADLSRAELDRHQADGLAALLAEVIPGHAFYARKFAEAGLSPSRLRFPADLRQLPFTTRAELLAAQEAAPPHGGLITYPFERYVRMHQTSGTTTGRPLRWYAAGGLLTVLLVLQLGGLAITVVRFHV